MIWLIALSVNLPWLYVFQLEPMELGSNRKVSHKNDIALITMRKSFVTFLSSYPIYISILSNRFFLFIFAFRCDIQWLGLYRTMAINIFRECILCASQFNIMLFSAVECNHILLYNHLAECGQSQHTRRIFGIQKYTRHNQQEPSQGHQNGIRGYHYVCIVVAAALLHILYCKISRWHSVWWTRSRWFAI